MSYFNPATVPQTPIPTIVQPLDEATLLSQPATTPFGSPPLTVSWTGQSYGVTGGVAGEALERPPDYSQASAPTDPVIYTFSPHAADSMLLVPPASAPDTRPRYHISVALNIFKPSAGVTTIRRGGSADGKFMGDFEWGDMRAKHTVTMGHVQLGRSQVMKWRKPKTGASHEYKWKWDEDDARRLHWVVIGHVSRCYLIPLNRNPEIWTPNIKTDTPLAVLSGRPLEPRADKRRQPLSALKVYPRAHEGPLLDYIVLGALMIEQTRLAPAEANAVDPLGRTTAYTSTFDPW